MNALSPGFPFEGWVFTPEGAAVSVIDRTVVIADVHLGYEWARGKAGDSVLAHSLEETVARLARTLERFPGGVSHLIVAGDLVESRRPCRQTDRDVASLRDWLSSQAIELVVLGGNHDPVHLVSDGKGQHADAVRNVAGWTIGHGHVSIVGPRVISGHLHPVFRLGGSSAPCFLASDRRIILPPFSANASGLDVLSCKLPPEWHSTNFRCLVSTGKEVLDFGPLHSLSERIRRRGASVRPSVTT